MDAELARFNMVEQQIRTWDVLDSRVLNLINRIKREHYVPEKYRDIAFADIRIPLNSGASMMEPKLEARILQSLSVNTDDRVLEVGTGSGYLTACLAGLADSVVSYEIDQDLHRQAGYNLASDGYENISLQVGDAMDLQSSEQFDVIVLTGSLPTMDKRFHGLLKTDGRMFMIVGREPAMEALLITRIGENEWAQESLFETEITPLVNARTPSLFKL